MFSTAFLLICAVFVPSQKSAIAQDSRPINFDRVLIELRELATEKFGNRLRVSRVVGSKIYRNGTLKIDSIVDLYGLIVDRADGESYSVSKIVIRYKPTVGFRVSRYDFVTESPPKLEGTFSLRQFYLIKDVSELSRVLAGEGRDFECYHEIEISLSQLREGVLFWVARYVRERFLSHYFEDAYISDNTADFRFNKHKNRPIFENDLNLCRLAY